MESARDSAVILLIGCLVAGCSDRPDTDAAARLLRSSLPDGWVIASTTDPRQFRPLRGLTKPVAQLTLTDESGTLIWPATPEKGRVFHPTLILLVFPITDLADVKSAVQKEGRRSDFPPVIFGLTDRYVLVTSPGYVNEGLHTPEAEATIQELRDYLEKTRQVR